MAFYKPLGRQGSLTHYLTLLVALMMFSSCTQSGETKQAALDRCFEKAKHMKSADYVSVLRRNSRWTCMFGTGSGSAKNEGEPSVQATTVRWTPIDRTPSLKKALAKLRSRLDIPVFLPPKLPQGSHLVSRKGLRFFHSAGPLTGRLTFLFGSEKFVIIDYGFGVFDGCGSGSGKPVSVNGQPGLVSSSSTATWTQLIWPATENHPEGTYGLTGSFSPRRALAIAESMAPPTKVAAEGGLYGC
jgi:hypothetical protein